tara:strand:- start:406 stop:996 length:591 start_codon:yes stop_codon:yes gene_type:complete
VHLSTPAAKNSSFAVRAISLTLATTLALMLLLWWMGRDWICFCGTVKLWQNEVFSYENSQHIADWYTFSHILHGILAYAVLTRFWPKTSCQTRFAIGVASAIAWEIIENTNFVIARFRVVTVSQTYLGDSIINSVFDIVAMMAGFFLARHLPIYLGVVLALLLEGSMMFFIRDGLALSTMMLIWPIDAVRMWQFGG